MSEILNIVQLIEENPSNKLTKTYQSNLINKIKDNFDTEEQKLFIASFYCYVNYKNDEFVVDLDNIWTWLGYSKKDKAKDLLEKFFKVDIDYKVIKAAPSNQGAAKKLGGAGLNKEKILMTIKTFKKMCMKANTKKSNDIHEYYIKLEETLHEVIDQESSELRKDLQLKNYLLEKSKIETKKLQTQLEKKRRKKYTFSNSVYLISNPSINVPNSNYYKIGKSGDMNSRLENYYVGAPLDYKVEHTRRLCSKREESSIEGLMLSIFDNYRCVNEIDSKREWVEGININTLKKELDILVDFLESRKKFHDPEFKTINENNNQDIEINDDKEESDIDQDIDDVEDNYSEEDNDVDNDVDNEADFVIEEEINEKIVDPRDFDKFIEECCIVNKEDSNHFVPKSELREAHRIWSNCTFRDVKKAFEVYLNNNFKSGASFIGESRRNVFRGIKIKQLTFTPSNKNLDFEKFIVEKCDINYHNRISYGSFYEYFEKYKQESDTKYKLTKDYKKIIKNYLNNKFLPGRVYISSVEKSIGLHGVYGLGIEDNNFGIKVRPRKNKKVGQFDSETKELLNSFDSLILASDKLKIPFSTLGNYVRFGKVINNKIYKLL